VTVSLGSLASLGSLGVVVAVALATAWTPACSGAAASRTGPDAAPPPSSASDASASDDSGASLDAGLDADAADAAPASGLDAGPLVLPQVGDLQGDGGTLAAPKLVAVTFPGDTEAAQIDAFTSAIGASQYWRTVTSEYGVGAAAGASIVETEAAPTAVNVGAGDPETWLATRFDGTHPEWGTFDPSAVYVVFYPSTTTATPSVGGCGGAYHDDLPITIASPTDGGASTSGTMIYAVVFRCATSPDVGRPSGVDLTTFMASHEMVEASTDPYGTAFLQTSASHVAWAYFFGSEVGDMCAFHANGAVTPTDIGFAVQRIWSNAAAAAFEDPCVPGASAPLFLAAPLGQGPITLSPGGGGAVASEGFALAAGQSITVSIRFYGAETSPWTVTPFTYTMEHGQPEPYLQFSPATLAGQSGDVVPLTITRVAADEDGNGGDAVKLVSTLGGTSNEWYFAITNGGG
jgi:hypothetical protein